MFCTISIIRLKENGNDKFWVSNDQDLNKTYGIFYKIVIMRSIVNNKRF